MDALATGDWTAFIEANARWAVPIVFLVAFAESVALLGFAVPAAALIAGAGVLVATGASGFAETCAAAVLGAILGDAASYWLGRTYGDRIEGLPPFRRKPELLARANRFFARHGGKSVFLARFIAPLRPVVPLVAGMTAMPHATFQAANILSALVWAPLLLASGVAMGKGVGLDELLTAGIAAPAPERSAPCGPAPPVGGEPPRC